jgi:acyl-CoA synthetase (AMP-forming)/AMP-acid ligase II
MIANAMTETIANILLAGSGTEPSILGVDGLKMSFDELRGQVERLSGQLRSLGIGPGDRVAIVLPNGPEMAITFLAVAATATAAPLNQTYREEEFRFYLDDLEAKALITLPGDAAAAHAALSPGAMRLSLEGRPGDLALVRDGAEPKAMDPQFAGPEDIALVLHTSGTTARPKIVPLSQRNLATSAGNIMASLSLKADDRCLNVMPLFHIHGLMAGLLSTLAAGASVVCTPGFDAFKFYSWLDEAKPTWYTAVPTMHQLVLSRADRQADVIGRNKLRFLRSSSASLPPIVMTDIEAAFGAPMIEAYGMTEASHQMTTNPLPPGVRKPGAVGVGMGVDVAIMDEPGNLLAPGETGEVVIKGGNVTAGYANNPTANAGAFTNGWFRTGDQGIKDGDGYLWLTGRLKEIINRGGEKISPREVDEVFLGHPAVAQAVAFAVPHDRLGEDVGCAIILKEGATATERELRDYAASHLADFKVPRTIVIVDTIPLGPTRKLARIGLAEKLGLGKK